MENLCEVKIANSNVDKMAAEMAKALRWRSTYISHLHKFEIILLLEHRNLDKIVIDRNLFNWYLCRAGHPISSLCAYGGRRQYASKDIDKIAEVQMRKNIRLVDLFNYRILLKHIYKIISFSTILKYITSFSVLSYF